MLRKNSKPAAAWAQIIDLSWWHKPKTLEKRPTVFSVLACLLVIGFISGWISLLLRNQISEEIKTTLGISNGSVIQASSLPLIIGLKEKPEDANSQSDDFCDSAECVYTAAAVLDKMNPAIEPCDDFYQFACGNFIEETHVAENMFSLQSKKLKQQIGNILMTEMLNAKAKHLSIPSDFYQACMDTTLIEDLGTQPIQQISDSLGGWPVIVGDSWDSDISWSWQETSKKFRRLGFNRGSVLNIAVGTDLRNSSKYIINVGQPVLRKSAGNLLKASRAGICRDFYDYMVDVAVMFGAELEAAKTELYESLEFELRLTEIALPPTITDLANDTLFSIKQLQISYPYIQWLDLINAFLTEGQEVDENEVVNLMAPYFFDQLGTLLESTSRRVIANYMMWSFYESLLEFLPKKFRERKMKYTSTLLDTNFEGIRWKECINMVTNNLRTIVGSLFVRKYLREGSNATVSEMVNNIRDLLYQKLDDATWMDDDAKKKAKKKLHDLKVFVGYPGEMLDDNMLEKYYRGLEINPQKYLKSYLNIKLLKRDNMFKKLRLPRDENNWIEDYKPRSVNAFYLRAANRIHIATGILQDPFFNPDLPNYMNYGAMGSIIGHEITHGFDIESSECIEEQYSNFTDKQTGLKINPYNTERENIADIGGVQLSYSAYKEWTTKNGEEKKLLGLNYTPRQMFWISFAQMWCAKYEKETLENIINYSSHLPNEFRVLGTLRSMKEFSLDFQCPANTSMNSMNKCKVW